MSAGKILSKYEEKIAALGFQLREFLFSALKDIHEEAVARQILLATIMVKDTKI